MVKLRIYLRSYLGNNSGEMSTTRQRVLSNPEVRAKSSVKSVVFYHSRSVHIYQDDVITVGDLVCE